MYNIYDCEKTEVDIKVDGIDPRDMRFYEKQTDSRSLFEGRVLHLFLDSVELPDGSAARREVIRHNGAVCVLPLTDEGDVICVRQYRHAVGKMMLELPAGKLDSKNENPTDAAMRELREETGFTCGRLTELGVMYGSPAILDEAIHLYLAEELTEGEARPDEGELLEVVRIPFPKLADAVAHGEVTDAKTQIAVLKAYLLKNHGGAVK